ncbi:hypothetical protein PIB30_088605 [Stylosanthes scabra]|uniref:Uncharacterized protein n=1 Tax=Stylosanthes scabra TaxID=79078 RepID=A0ABU6VTK7_9FABA|nr:hypothetical protein [Stylosanthes scabra]
MHHLRCFLFSVTARSTTASSMNDGEKSFEDDGGNGFDGGGFLFNGDGGIRDGERRTAARMLPSSSSSPSKQSDSRCTPMKFRAIYDKLSDDKKALVDEMGLGAFQHLPNDYINHKILNELVWSYDVFTNKISRGVGEFLITSEKVGHAFGLNYNGELFEKKQKNLEDKLNDEEKEALKLFKGKSLTFVQNMIIYFEERYEGKSLNDPNAPPPWIQRWCGDNLKEKIRAEDEDITGLIHLELF